MANKEGFRLFVEKLLSNRLKENDWETFAVSHYNDEDLEKMRVRIVRCFYPQFQFNEISEIQRNELNRILDVLRET